VITFDGSGSFDLDGTIVSYEWDFGGGMTGAGGSPTHSYAADGVYLVSLTVTDDGGLTDTATTTADISPVPNQPPTADPNGPYTANAGEVITFDGSGSSDPDGTIVSYDWDFGDGMQRILTRLTTSTWYP
jgi:PKD repeat protein